MLSVCLVICNEEKIIIRCLESIKNIADEIIIILDGSQRDKTYKICQRYTDKIFVRKHIGFSDPHFPFAFNKTSGNWIMRIDADEFLLPKYKEKIKDLMKNDRIDGYFFLWRLWNGKKYITKNKPYKPVLFRKSKLFFVGVPHGIMQTYGKSKKVNIHLKHQPQYNNWRLNVFRKKHIKRARLHAKFLFKKFIDIPKFNYSGEDYSFSIKIRKRLCFLFPIFGFYRFITDIATGEKNVEAIKVSFFRGVYEMLFVYFIMLEIVKRILKYDNRN